MLVAAHLVLHARVEQVDHRRLVARELRIVFGVELLARRIDVGRVDAVVDRIRARLRLRERVVGGGQNDLVDLFLNRRRSRRRSRGPVRRATREYRDWVARGVRFALGRRPVHHLVVRQRVRVRTNHVRVNERRTLSSTARTRRALRIAVVARDEVAAVDFLDGRSGNERTSFEIEPPAVFTSTGTEIA